MATKAGEIQIDLIANNQKFNQGMKKAEQSAFSFKRAAETAIGFGVANAANMALSAMKTFTVESTKMALDFEQRFSSMTRLVEGDSQAFMKQLQEASDFTVSKLDLVAATNKAMLLGISQDAMPQLIEASRLLGAAMGVDAAQAIDDITTGLGRQSRMILDNLGIIIKTEEAYKNFATTLGIAKDELTSTQEKQAFLNAFMEKVPEIMAKLDGSITDGTTKVGQYEAAIKDMKIEFGKFATAALIDSGALGYFTESIKFTTDALIEYDSWMDKIIAKTLGKPEFEMQYPGYLDKQMESPHASVAIRAAEIQDAAAEKQLEAARMQNDWAESMKGVYASRKAAAMGGRIIGYEADGTPIWSRPIIVSEQYTS